MVSEYTENIKKIVDTMGMIALVDDRMLKFALNGFQYDEVSLLNDLVAEIKTNVIPASISSTLTPDEFKIVKDLEKNIAGIKMAYVRGDRITSLHNEALRSYVMSNNEHLKSLLQSANSSHINRDVQVFIDNGRYAIEKTTGKKTNIIYVTDFTLEPKSIITIDNRDIEAQLYNFEAVSAINKRRSQVYLTAADFNTAGEFTKAIQRTAKSISPGVQDLQSHMRGMMYELKENVWRGMGNIDQIGTTVLGYERFVDDGEKYVCTVNGDVYNSKGEVISDVVFVDPAVRIPGDTFSLAKTYGNMEYDETKWIETAKFLLGKVMKANKKDVMANVFGWFIANIQEYNIRKEISEFPLLHIAGPKSSGKTLTIRALKQYFGHVRDDIDNFPTPPIFTQNLTVSYTIPSIVDEYGGSDRNEGWSDFVYNEVHKILKSVYAKGVVEKGGKGDGGQGRFQYKMRNSSCTMGQTSIRDKSIADRAIQVNIDGSIKDTEEGDVAYNTCKELIDRKDKNFITGLMIWCMNIPDEEIKDLVRGYVKYNLQTVRREHLKYDNRQQQNTAAIQTGLHLALRLATEMGVDIGFDEQYIKDTVVRNANMHENLFSQTTDDALVAFLRDVALHLKTVGTSTVYGLGKIAFCEEGKGPDVPGVYGRSKRNDACIFDSKCLLMNVRNLIGIINKDLQKHGKNAHDFAAIQGYLSSEFHKAKARKGKGLVLAPESYRYAKRIDGTMMQGWYTVFRLNDLLEIDDAFGNNQFWSVGTEVRIPSDV